MCAYKLDKCYKLDNVNAYYHNTHTIYKICL